MTSALTGGSMRNGWLRKVAGSLLILLALMTAGCATMRGLGEDIQSLGRGVKKVFTP